MKKKFNEKVIDDATIAGWKSCLLKTFNSIVAIENILGECELLEDENGWHINCSICSSEFLIASAIGRFRPSNFYAHIKSIHAKSSDEPAEISPSATTQTVIQTISPSATTQNVLALYHKTANYICTASKNINFKLPSVQSYILRNRK